jgi:hypothetical protein
MQIMRNKVGNMPLIQLPHIKLNLIFVPFMYMIKQGLNLCGV